KRVQHLRQIARIRAFEFQFKGVVCWHMALFGSYYASGTTGNVGGYLPVLKGSMPQLEEIATKIEAEVRRRANIGADDKEFNRAINMFEYGYLDSFGAVELVEFVERNFRIRVSDEALATQPLNSVNEIAAFVLRNLTQ
ncbi:MAG: acyl carrier protein, partial [Planctomycetes bacterium]|nr:acyl carrier protein [Planctomycetota bacterium]